MSVRIKPTVGRQVHYWLAPGSPQIQPMAATIVHVLSGSRVNLSVLDAEAKQSAELNVLLIQEGDVRPITNFCEWMPYQKQVASGQIEPTLHKT